MAMVYPETVRGFGVDLSEPNWQANVNSLLKDEILRNNDGIWDAYQEFFEMYGPDYDMDDDDAWDAFCDKYEDVDSVDRGMTAMLTTILNERHFGGATVYQFMDLCLYVEAYVPENEESRAFMPTQEQIRKQLSDLLDPLLVNPLPVEYLVIHL